MPPSEDAHVRRGLTRSSECVCVCVCVCGCADFGHEQWRKAGVDGMACIRLATVAKIE